MKRLLMTLALLGSVAGLPGAAAQTNATTATVTQTSVLTIPALPPGVSAGVPAPVTASPVPAAPGSLSTVTTLPAAAQRLPGTYTVALDGPSAVTAGEATTWAFTLTNTGTAPIHAEYGACDVRFEVLNAAGEVVRANPGNSICTLQLVILDAAPGETQTVQNVRWRGQDSQGQPLSAGTYTLRAKFVRGGQQTAPATLNVVVR